MSIKLKKQSASSVAIPSDAYVQLYVGTDGLPRIKDSRGSTVELSQSGVVSLVQQANSPSSEPDKFKIYSKDVDDVAELFFMDDAGQEIQVTSDGELNGGGGGGGLTQDPTVQHASFTANVNTAYYVWTADGMTKTITLTTIPSEGDMVEVSALGGGSDNITIDGNGNDVTWGGNRYSQALTFHSAGFHALLRWTNENGGQWCNIADNVTARFGSNGGGFSNSVVISDTDGRVYTHPVDTNAVLGRVGSFGNLTSIVNHTKVLDSDFTISQTAPDYVTPLQWTLLESGVHYCFEFHLAVQQSGAPGVVGFGVSYSNFVSPVTYHATLVRASNVSTQATVTTYNTITTVDDSAARAVGQFETVITGSVKTNGAANLSLLGKRSAGTTKVLNGSWGRIWRAETVF